MSTPMDQMPDAVVGPQDYMAARLDADESLRAADQATVQAQSIPTPTAPTIQQAQSTQQQVDQADPFTGLPPVDHLNELMSVSPLLIGLTALGGKGLGVPPQAMLAATNGMVSGLIKGDQQAYQNEKEKYDSEYQRWERKHNELFTIFKELQSAYKSQFGEQQGALKAANALKGIAQAKEVKAEHMLEYLRKGKEFRDREADRAAKASKDEEGNLLKAMAQLSKVSQGYSRLSSAVQYTDRMSAILPSLIEKYKAKTGSTVVPNSVGELLTAISDDPAVGEYVQLSKDLKAALVGVEMPQGTRGNMFIQKIISETAPNLWTMSAAQLQTQMAGAKTLLNETKETQKKQIDAYQTIISRHKGPDMTPGEAKYETPNPELPSKNAAPEKGEKSKSKSGKPIHWDGTQWVYD